MSQVMGHLNIQSTRGKTALLLGVCLAYLAAYVSWEEVMCATAGVTITAPVITAGLLFGFRGGLAAGLISFPVNPKFPQTEAYESYVNSYLVKPVDFTRFTRLMKDLGFYWLCWNRQPWR